VEIAVIQPQGMVRMMIMMMMMAMMVTDNDDDVMYAFS